MSFGGSLPQINLGGQDYRNCAIYHSRLLLHALGRDQSLLAEYGIYGFKVVIQNAVLDLNRREDRHVIRMTLMDRVATSPALSQEGGHLQDNKFLHKQFDDVCCSMESQPLPLTPLHYRQGRLQWCDARQTWGTNGAASFFQINQISVYSIKMVTSVFGVIRMNAHWQRAFVLVITIT
ncbi:hypothetical protein TNCV_3532121 [Trichonephila clavipes]|nr:hypothetical protein TNCV_3532121 [Trichonephila clavipes]